MSDFHSRLEEIINDKSSGSRDLLTKIHFLLSENVSAILGNPDIIQNIKHKFAGFQTIISFCDSMLKAETENEISEILNSFMRNNEILYDLLFKHAFPFLENFKSFITISNSRTVYEIIKRLTESDKNYTLTVCESRPNNEGIIMAERFAGLGLKVKIITEAQIGGEIRDAECVILGADKILRDGSIINKVGSLVLAICAKYYDIPVLVLADKTKFTENTEYQHKLYSAGEIYDSKNDLIYITNYYFEKLDRTYITNIISV
jgi:translation initiation factor eIF-2B subunit delta